MKLKTGIFAMIAAAVLAQSAATAGQIQINFSDNGFYNGTLTPTNPSSTVWATAVFEDTGVAGHVKLTMSVLPVLAGDKAYVNQWNFNVFNTPDIMFTNIDAPSANVTYRAPNCCKLGQSGTFDLNFSFPTPNPGQLAQGGNSIYEMVGIGLTAASFNDLTAVERNGSGGFLAAVKVQGDGVSYDVRGVLDEGTIPPQGSVPEPGTLALLGLGLLGVSLARRRT